jgi:superfamily II DNA/RNA helicase
MDTKTDNAFNLLSPSIITKLKEINITQPTKVQDKVIPLINEGKSIVFESETGTGKTYAYLLPLINNLEKEDDKTKVKILIAAPTFELASQINASAKLITQRKTALFIGGSPLKRQIETLKEKPEIVIGNPARLVELIRLKKLKVQDVNTIVFDECDRLIKKELIDDTRILKELVNKDCRIIALSATITKQVKDFFKDAETVIMPKEDILTKNITHWAFYAERRDKIETLRKILNAENYTKVLVFTSRIDQVSNIYTKLRYKNIDCMTLTAKADKKDRKAAIDRFRSGKTKILITSDLCTRGLDIPNISHIIQMDLPSDEDFFIHRSGRTGRAGQKGINIVIGDEYEMNQFAALEKKIGITVYPKEIYNGKIQAPKIYE